MIYPIGIPAPWVEPDVTRPALPSPWNSEVPGYSWVNWSTGTDTGRTWGTQAAPRKTIKSPVPAGSITIVEGVYVGSNPTRIRATGDSGAWVANTSGPAWVCGLDADNRTAYTFRVLMEGSYLYMDQVNNKGSSTRTYWQVSSSNPAALISADHIMLRNFELEGAGASSLNTAFPITGSTFAETPFVIVYNGVIHGYGPLTPDIDRDHVGIFAQNYTNNVWALNNVVYDMAGAGLTASTETGNTTTVHDIFYGFNRVYDTWGVGIALKGSDRVVYSQNDIGPIKYTTWTNGKCMGAQYACKDVWFIFNLCRGGDYGIKIASTNGGVTENIYLIGNEIYDIQEEPGGSYDGNGFGAAAIGFWGGDNRIVVNNTIYNCVAGVRMPHGEGAVIENNIISEMEDEHIQIADGFTGSVVNNNCLFQTGGGEIIRYSTTNRTVAQFQAAGLGTGNIASDPTFVNAGANNFNLQVASLCINAGSNTFRNSLDATFLADYGESISFDFNANPSPFGAAWDMGAFEYGAGPVPTPPDAPTDLTLVAVS